ncbi:neural cell adhesion molecule 1b [Trichomycterus rosablanca]|uniref:neural cell adhesion molecule 1b n=1 Tax=Trichomycterus rosablanca TaxID=2290929 RepID=UPI002F35EB6E
MDVIREMILMLLYLGSAASLQVSITPAQGEISVGESKFFLCEVAGGVKEMDWFSPTGEKIESNRQDITVIRNDETSSTLTIYSASVENAGTYKCIASNKGQQAEATVNVKIYQKISFPNAPSPQEFSEGDTAIIVCDVVSSPPPTVIWKHKKTKIDFDKDVRFSVLNNNHLQIKGIRKADEGVYTCEGLIMARGEIDFRYIHVVVNVLPTVRVRYAEVNATAETGGSAMLACDADGFPEPTVTWARSEVLLESGDKYSFNEDGSEITIMDVKKLDEGDYTCTATNKAGKSEEEVSLKVFVKPKITFLENQSTTEMEEQIRLTCEATGDPTPSITWSFGSQVFTDGEQASWTRPEQHKGEDGSVVARSDARLSSLTVKDVQYTDAGEYLCTATNAVGQSSQSTYLEVRYAPKLLGSLEVFTWEGNPVNISCVILAHPSDVSIMWMRDEIQLPNVNITNIKIYNTPNASYLQVTPDSQSDFGSYNCTASNEIGTESKEFILIQADVPSAPAVTQVKPYSSTAQVLFNEPESTGGIPVLKYHVEWKAASKSNWIQHVYEVREEMRSLTITGLKPETRYEVRLSAINGKGRGESSSVISFKTEPVQGEPSPPKLKGSLEPKGNALKVNWIKQDDGGSPITHYLVRYKAKEDAQWKTEMRVPSTTGYALLSGLDWNTEYDVLVVAENQQGKSQPGMLSFRTSSEPSATPDFIEDDAGLNTGVIVGILILVCVVVLLVVDATCCFLNKCGLLMCLCGKPGTGTKGKDVEAGKAALVKDDSKEPIVEMRSEDGLTANHDVGGHSEPNETTPLTEPERHTEVMSSVVDLPLSVATNSDTVTDTFDLSQSSPISESTTLTSSLTAPPSEPKPTSNSFQPLDPSLLSSEPPLVDLADPQTSGPSNIPAETQIKPSELDTQAPPSPAFSADKEPKDLEAEPTPTGLSTNPPISAAPVSSENHVLQIDGDAASLSHLPQDASDSLDTAASVGPSALPNENMLEEKMENGTEEEELKKIQPGAAAEPNAISQTNGAES